MPCDTGVPLYVVSASEVVNAAVPVWHLSCRLSLLSVRGLAYLMCERERERAEEKCGPFVMLIGGNCRG